MMRRKRAKRNKLRMFTILLLLIGISIGAFYVYKAMESKPAPVDERPITTEPPDEENTENGQTSSLEQIVEETFSLAKEGKVPIIPFVSGQTESKEVMNKWGKSDQITETEKGRYEEYNSHHATIGYTNETVSDIRSFDSKLQDISLHDIKKSGGEPDTFRYYKDSSHDQMILVYQVSAATELLWVLPIATEKEPNPKVDHISLYTKIEKPSNEDENQTNPDTISNMSIDDKIGQMILAGISGTSMDTDTERLLTDLHIGGIIFYKPNLETPAQTVELINQLKKGNRSSLPLFLSVDQEGGRVTRLPGGLENFPTNEQIGKVNNPEFSYKIGTLLGYELKEFGFNLDFGPVLDINSNPNNPVIGDRSFGNNPEIVSELGIQTMKGIQSQNVISTIKHFPGHGDTSVDSHLDLPVVNKSLNELKNLELIPFERAMNQGADVVMIAHILMPQLDKTNPASMSKAVITDLLRKQLGYKGVIITDDMTMGAITEHFDIGNAAVESVKAGSDIILVGHDFQNVVKITSSLKDAINRGEISEERLNESVARIIELKKKYNLNDAKVKTPNINEINQSINALLNEYVQ